MKNLGRYATIIASMLCWNVMGCGADAGGNRGVTMTADGGTTTPPGDTDLARSCNNACLVFARCSAMSGEPVSADQEARCRTGCVANAPPAACFACFTGACASSCSESCLQCVFDRCARLVSPQPADADAGTVTPPPPPPPQDAGPSEPVCGTNRLDPGIGRSCTGIGEDECGGALVCERNTRNALTRYCTQPCQTIADCPCQGGEWTCALIPGRSAVQRYCRNRSLL